MKIDLHLHSHVSDGDLSPAALVRTAVEAGLGLISLTDHDTAAGVAEAMEMAEALPVSVIPGIEMSTCEPPYELHLLGYWIDPASAPIVRHQEGAERRRVERMEAMIRRLQGMGVRIEMEEVRRAAGPEARSLGRPHLARALLASGQIRSFGEAFTRYIGDRGPAFVSQDFPAPAEAIRAIREAGGVAVWAHPPLDIVAELLPGFAEAGLEGVECYRPGATPADVDLLRGLAKRHGLFLTGGSDWHGPRRTALGDFYLAASQVPELLARGGLVA